MPRELDEAQLTTIPRNRAQAVFRRAQQAHAEAVQRAWGAAATAAGASVEPLGGGAEPAPLPLPEMVTPAMEVRCLRWALAEHGGSACVCGVELAPGDDVVRLPCLHVYHHACMARWFAEDTLDRLVGPGHFETTHRMRCPVCNIGIAEMGG